MKLNKTFFVGIRVLRFTLLGITALGTAFPALAGPQFQAAQQPGDNQDLQPQEGPLVDEAEDSYPAHPGFPIRYDLWTERASPTIADIDNNGSAELLLPTYAGGIYVWDGAGRRRSGFSVASGWRLRGRLALADLNADGNLEIAAGAESTSTGVGPRIYIWRPDGTLLPGWPKSTDCATSDIYCTVAQVILADIDKDGTPEVIAGTTNRNHITSDPSRYTPNLYVWRASGQVFPGAWPNEDDHNVAIIGQMAVGDLDGDSYLDIVTGRDYNRLFAYNASGQNLPNWPHYVWSPYDRNNWTDDQIEFPRSSPALADLDQNGSLEYIIAGHRRPSNTVVYYDSQLLIYTAQATRWPGWETPAASSSLISSQTTRMIEAPAIGDLTGDNRPEIVLATQDGYVRAYTAEKRVLWAYNYAQGKPIHAGEVVIGDVDGDGRNDVVFGTFDLHLGSTGPVGVYVLGHDGALKSGAPMWVASPGVSSTPVLGDLDGDGLIEIAAASYNGWIYVWDAPGQALPERMPWPMARHDLMRTGQYGATEKNLNASSMTASMLNPQNGATFSYTIKLISTGAEIPDEIHLTDTLPSGLEYVPGSLAASSGETDATDAPTLTWRGSMSDVRQVTITFSVRVNTPNVVTAINTAVINAGSAGTLNRRSIVILNGRLHHIPLVLH